jgi:hypothetical protein
MAIIIPSSGGGGSGNTKQSLLFPVGALETIAAGKFIGIIRGTGYVRELTVGDQFVGISASAANNSAGADGAINVRVYTSGTFQLTVTGATQPLTGIPVFATSNSATSVTTQYGGTIIGTLLSVVSTNIGMVRIETMIQSLVELVVAARLESSLSGSTKNMIMHTQRPIIATSVQVSFNTVPNSGNMEVGYDNTTPNEIAVAFNLGTLTANTPTSIPLTAARSAPAAKRLWAKVGQATTTAGVDGLLTMRYIELP